MVADVRRAIVASGIRPACLHIEITETALVTDLSLMSARLRDLRALGVCVAIDDFGTGFTSIHQLSRLAVDVLKIDRSFVERVANVADRRIIELIIELGHTLGMTVVAEGIESAEQRQALTDLNCDLLQGYHLGRPAARSQIQGNIDRDEVHAKEPHLVSISLAQS